MTNLELINMLLKLPYDAEVDRCDGYSPETGDMVYTDVEGIEYDDELNIIRII